MPCLVLTFPLAESNNGQHSTIGHFLSKEDLQLTPQLSVNDLPGPRTGDTHQVGAGSSPA